ncbi:MAG: GNAT family N-acetyltransferase [Myxococcota bacterium]
MSARDGLRMVNVTPELAPACGALELVCFPHATPSELIGEDDVRAYAHTFPEGFFVVLDGDRVVGQGAGIFLDFDFDHPQHTIVGLTGEHQCGNHDPNGAWYYGTDMAVHPEYRGRGIGRWLYEARKDLVRRRHKAGILAGAHLPGYAAWKDRISAEEYIRRVVAGELDDPTLTFQLHNGFEVLSALEGYLEDHETGSWAAFIRWRSDGLGGA